jgi:hypothetical protein
MTFPEIAVLVQLGLELLGLQNIEALQLGNLVLQ